MSDESGNVSVPASLFQRFLDRLFPSHEPVAGGTVEVGQLAAAVSTLAPTGDPDQYQAVLSDRDQLKARIEQMEAEKLVAEERTKLVSQLQTVEQFGASWVELSKAEEAAGVLMGMNEEQRSWVLRNFSALSQQIKESNLTGEIGSAGDGMPVDSRKALDLAIAAKAKTEGITYLEAVDRLTVEKPELFNA